MNLDHWKHLASKDGLENMDWRHVQMIHAVLSHERPRGVVEIGLASGFSTSAIIEAISVGDIMEADLVDKQIRESVRTMTAPYNGIRLHEMDSKDFRAHWAECWIIDGDHREGAITDYQSAKDQKARIIIAHDTAHDWCTESQFGSIKIGGFMRESALCYFEDMADRPNEKTKRGLTIAFYKEPHTMTMETLKGLAK